jgi:hypothetical protein
MDYYGQAFTDTLLTKEWRTNYLAGLQAAAQIAERVLTTLGLDRSELSGEPASLYLAQVLSKLEQHAEAQAAKSYGRYRWLWYLRRVPDDVFAGNLATTGPYDRCLTEVLATRGAGPAHCLSTPSADGKFPIDGTVIKRVAHICGFSRAYSQYQVDYRIVGKGGSLTFDRQLHGIPFPMSRARTEASLDREIAEYDRRNENQKVFSRVGVPIDEYDPDKSREEPVLFQVAKIAGTPPIVSASKFNITHTVAMRYCPNPLLARELQSLLSHPTISVAVPWNPELPVLISLLHLATIVFGQSPTSRSQLLQTGYIIVVRADLDDLYNDSHRELRELPLLAAFAENSPDESLSTRLLRMEGRPSPLLSGPIAFLIDDTRMGIDLQNATRRFHDLLEFPSVHGEPANIRSRAFEEKVQEVIDGSAWAPPENIRRLIGHHFKRDGKRIGEVDAFGTSDRTLVLVSCKSVIYTAEYDRGEYAVVRNVRTMLEQAVTRFGELQAHFTRLPDGGSEYDFTSYQRIVSVVITPQVMFVREPLLSQESLPGLRTYSSFEEFRRWLETSSESRR